MQPMTSVPVPVDPIPELQKLGRSTHKLFQGQTRLISACAAVNIALMLVLFIFVKVELNAMRAELQEIQTSALIAAHDTTGESTLGHNPRAETTSEPNTSEATPPPQNTEPKHAPDIVDTQPDSSGITLDVAINDTENVRCALFSDGKENRAEAILEHCDNEVCSIEITEDGGTKVVCFVINRKSDNIFLEVIPGEFLSDVDMSSLQYAWEYRFTDGDAWYIPNEEIFPDGMSDSSITYNAEMLNGESAELRCKITGKCKNGMVVRLTLAGICINNEKNLA